MMLNETIASQFARIALGHVTKQYPYKMDHVLLGDEDALPPRVLHPIFTAASIGTVVCMAGGPC